MEAIGRSVGYYSIPVKGKNEKIVEWHVVVETYDQLTSYLKDPSSPEHQERLRKFQIEYLKLGINLVRAVNTDIVANVVDRNSAERMAIDRATTYVFFEITRLEDEISDIEIKILLMQYFSEEYKLQLDKKEFMEAIKYEVRKQLDREV